MSTAATAIARDAFLVPTPRTSSEQADASTLLPTRAQLFDHLGDLLAGVGDRPAVLLMVGLLRKDDGWPTPASTLGSVTRLLAADVRQDDWLARSGPGEFALVLAGGEDNAETAAARLTAGIARLGIPGLGAAAGIAGLAPELTAGETHRRGTLCLTAARAVGPGSVIRYRGTR